jgi:hypothetical protein
LAALRRKVLAKHLAAAYSPLHRPTATARKELQMNQRTTPARQATAIGLAALVTFAMLGSVDRLATQPAAEMQLAQQNQPTQTVIIEGRRVARS